jgi:hypothetical protein
MASTLTARSHGPAQSGAVDQGSPVTNPVSQESAEERKS